MLRAALLVQLLVAPLGSGCSRALPARTPIVRVESRRLDGPRPAQVALRCRAEGLKPPVKLLWRFAVGVKTIGWNVPADEPVVLVEPPERGPSWAECAATGDDQVVARATHALNPMAITAAPATAKVGELVTVRGSGFGPASTDGDGLWLVPSGPGPSRLADGSCKGAAWNDGTVSACVPPSARGAAWQVRVQAGGQLALAPKPMVVAP